MNSPSFNIESWAAGIIDGEGWVGISKTKSKRKMDYYRIAVQVHNTNPIMLKTLKNYFGGSISGREPKREEERNLFCWYIQDSGAYAFLHKVKDYMVCKKEEVMTCLKLQDLNIRFKGRHYYNIPEEIYLEKETLYKTSKELKNREHDLSVLNHG